MTASRPALLCAAALAVLMTGSVSTAQTVPAGGPQAAVANPSAWPAAASPTAITDARTEAAITDLMA
ncbi:hypothetical protein, partial [uncultured Brevundimonas sp.]|uniref:hypothetical protein n=1 Tax=uncultured Brevundimonas sp. TaxID=213418 RepID=UPI0025E7D8CC